MQQGPCFKAQGWTVKYSIQQIPELAKAYNMQTWKVLLSNKTAYELVDAPKGWFLCFAEAMEQSGYLTIGLEPCVWRLLNKKGQVVAVARKST